MNCETISYSHSVVVFIIFEFFCWVSKERHEEGNSARRLLWISPSVKTPTSFGWVFPQHVDWQSLQVYGDFQKIHCFRWESHRNTTEPTFFSHVSKQKKTKNNFPLGIQTPPEVRYVNPKKHT